MDRVVQALKTTSYSEIARRSNTTVGFISMLFRGQRRAKMETLAKVAKALGVTLDEIHEHLSQPSRPVNSGKSHGWSKSGVERQGVKSAAGPGPVAA